MNESTCKRGHTMTPENVYVRANGRSECRQCQAHARKAKRHASGVSLKYHSSNPQLAVLQAASHALEKIPGPESEAAIQALAVVLGRLGGAL